MTKYFRYQKHDTTETIYIHDKFDKNCITDIHNIIAKCIHQYSNPKSDANLYRYLKKL